MVGEVLEPNASNIILLGSSIASLLIVISARRRVKKGKVPVSSIDIESFKRIRVGDYDVQAAYEALEAVKSLLGKPLPGVTPILPIGGWHHVTIDPTIIEGEFSGEWRVSRIGCGGWGCTFLGERGGKRVVFKVPRGFEGLLEEGVPSTISGMMQEKIVERARIISKLRHPHILRLLAYSRRVPLLVYEYADMGSLEDQLSRGWRPGLREVVLLGAQLADALRYIHSRGLVHGDIKSTNILVVGGVAKLGDFSSLSRLLASTSRGVYESYTIGWRAPEQVYLELKRKAIELGVENRADVYQLGNLILYMLTGELVDGEDRADEDRFKEILEKVANRDLQSIIARMMELEPWRRPSAEETSKMMAALYIRLAENR